VKDIELRIYAKSIAPYSEHRQLRDAADAASESGETTWLCNGAGVRIAAIVPASAVAGQPEQEK
jgi:hypothetical protein